MRCSLYEIIFSRLSETEIVLANQKIVSGKIHKVTSDSVWILDDNLESIVVVDYNNICEVENLAA